MAFNLFGSKEKNGKKPAPQAAEVVAEEKQSAAPTVFAGAPTAMTHKLLKGTYLSEKASQLQTMSQYVFRVFPEANKHEIKKQVATLYNVKVKSVRVLNMPKKRKDLGRHPGFRSGFKKAIVVLHKGEVISQARP